MTKIAVGCWTMQATIETSKFGRRTAWRAAAVVILLSALSSPACAGDWIIGSAQAAVPPPTYTLPDRVQSFHIAAQSLVTALDAFGAATGIQIFYNARLTANRTSPGVSGVLSPADALGALLNGTALAPVPTGPNAITLILSPESVTLNAAPVSLAPGPTLALDTVHVAAPPVADLRLYAMTVQYAVLSALRKGLAPKKNGYSAQIDLWLTPSGGVQHSRVQVSSGDTGIDGLIESAVQRVEVGQAPPSDLPLPVHIRIMAAQ